MRKHNWLLATALTVGLIGATQSPLAAPQTLTNNFDSAETSGNWNINFGTGTIEWNSTNGVDGSGCMMAVLSAAAPENKEVAPNYTLGELAFSTADYVMIEYDLMIDPASGFSASGNYGDYQEVLRDSGWSWDSHWVGALGSLYNGWTHMKLAVPNNGKSYPYLTFALQGTAPYTTNVIFYIDNLVISAFQNPLVAGTFPNETEAAKWTAAGLATTSFSTKDAANAAGSGSLKIEGGYTADNSGWQESFALFDLPFAPNRYTYVSFDVFLENPNSLTGFGIMNLFTKGWASLGGISFNINNVGKWTHFEIALPSSVTSADGLRFQFGGSMTNTLIYYLDNVKLYKPITPPTVGGLLKAGPAGVQVTMDDDSSQWQRDAISTPADASQGSFFWAYQEYPVSYSFTLSDFPAPGIERRGFEAHMYLVNGDSVTGNELSGAADWNAADIIMLRIINRTNDVICVVDWKTNLPVANPLTNALYHPVSVAAPSAIGTWTLTFNNLTNATVTGPGITATNFDLPEEAVYQNFSPSRSFIQFGAFKNDGDNDGHNNQRSATFSRVKYTGAGFPFDDSFDAPSLTNNYVWRTTRASAVTFVPQGTAWWLNWTLPADNYTVESAAEVTGPYSDASVTNKFQRGAKMFGAVPADALPNTNQVFFRLSKPE